MWEVGEEWLQGWPRLEWGSYMSDVRVILCARWLEDLLAGKGTDGCWERAGVESFLGIFEESVAHVRKV